MINKKTNNLLLKLSAIILIVVLSVLSARRTEAAFSTISRASLR